MSSFAISRFHQRHYAVLYMIAAFILCLGILVALCMPRPAYAQTEQVTVYETIISEEGDTLWDLALRYVPQDQDIRSYIQEVQDLNRMSSDRIYEGQSIVMPMQRSLAAIREGEAHS